MSRLLLCLGFLLGYPVLASSHELPDGEIERRVQISVKPDCVLVEYTLTMGEATLEKELRKNGHEPTGELSDKWKQYQDLILPMLGKNTLVTMDGATRTVRPIRATYSGWSHGHLACLLIADVSLTKKQKTIVVTDRNFLDVPGEYRIALKGRSGAILEKSSTPLLVSRADPVDLAKLTKAQKQAATRAMGEFVLSDRENAASQE